MPMVHSLVCHSFELQLHLPPMAFVLVQCTVFAMSGFDRVTTLRQL